MEVLANIGNIFVVFVLLIGFAILIPGIAGTIITGKIKGSPKILRVLSVITLVLGIAMCALGILIPICRLIAH